MKSFARLLCLAALGTALSGHAQTNFVLTDLGTLGGTASKAFGINSSGTVVGGSATSGNSPVYAFSYSGGTMTNLETTGTMSEGHAINSDGVIVGQRTNGGVTHAFSYSGGGFTDLGTLNGVLSSNAASINSSGVIVGSSQITGGANRAFSYTEGGGMINLGTMGGTGSLAWDINSSGQIVGQSQLSGGAVNAFLLNSGTLTSGNSIGTLAGGTNSAAFAINDAGVIVGQSEFSGGGALQHAFRYNGSFTDLGTLGGNNSVARDINSSGFIVGSAQVSGGTYHAFFYNGSTLYDLNDYVSGASGWVLTEAWAINDAGLIVGTGTFEGQTRAFVLTAVPEPSTYAVLAGLAALGLAVWRRRGHVPA